MLNYNRSIFYLLVFLTFFLAVTAQDAKELEIYSPPVSFSALDGSSFYALLSCRLDGKLSVLDPMTGSQIWSSMDPYGPLLKSSKHFASESSDFEYIIEPYGPGHLYYYHTELREITRFPWTLRSLCSTFLTGPLLLPNGHRITCSRKVRLLELHPSAGSSVKFGRITYKLHIKTEGESSWVLEYSEYTSSLSFSRHTPAFAAPGSSSIGASSRTQPASLVGGDTAEQLPAAASPSYEDIQYWHDLKSTLYATNGPESMRPLWRHHYAHMAQVPLSLYKLYSKGHDPLVTYQLVPILVLPIRASGSEHPYRIHQSDKGVYYILPDYSAMELSGATKAGSKRIPWWPSVQPRKNPVWLSSYSLPSGTSFDGALLEFSHSNENEDWFYPTLDSKLLPLVLEAKLKRAQVEGERRLLLPGATEAPTHTPPVSSPFASDELPQSESAPSTLFLRGYWYRTLLSYSLLFLVSLLLLVIMGDWIYYRVRRYKRKQQVKLRQRPGGSMRMNRETRKWSLFRHDDEEYSDDEAESNGLLAKNPSSSSSKGGAASVSSSTHSHGRSGTPLLLGEMPSQNSSLLISSDILGYGSHGTVVYRGLFTPATASSSSSGAAAGINPSGSNAASVSTSRPVAIKRLLLDFYSLAEHEISLLGHSDSHPNIVRYYVHEILPPFMYIALELCPCSLLDLVSRQKETELSESPELGAKKVSISRTMVQGLFSGLAFLHSIKIVHRDIKPANILLSPKMDRLLLSDFGLSKRIESSGNTSTLGHAGGGIGGSTLAAGAYYLPTVCGTVGWRAPEILLWEALQQSRMTLATPSPPLSPLHSSGSSTTTPTTATATATMAVAANTNESGSMTKEQPPAPPPGFSLNATVPTSLPFRLQASLDIFSAGCLLYWILSEGHHPFGSGVGIESNILKGVYELGALSANHQLERSVEAVDLISSMIQKEPKARPSIEQVLNHPYFWTEERRLGFLMDVSDRVTLIPDYHATPGQQSDYSGDEGYEGAEQHFMNSSAGLAKCLQHEWRHRQPVPSPNWMHALDPLLRRLLSTDPRRSYYGSKVVDLLRAIRNKRHHYQDLPIESRRVLGELPGGFCRYWTSRFPTLVMCAWKAVFLSGLLDDPNESVFRAYYSTLKDQEF